MTRLRVLALAAVVSALAACASGPSFREPTPDPSVKLESPTNGIVVGSATHEIRDGAEAAYAGYRFHRADGGGAWSVVSQQQGLMSRARHFEDVNGVVFAKELPAGEYVLTNWWLNNGTGMTVSPREPVPIQFTVRAGEAVYIGNLHMTVRTGDNIFGITITAGGWPEIVDHAERDLPVIRSAYPALPDIRVGVLDGRHWERSLGESPD